MLRPLRKFVHVRRIEPEKRGVILTIEDKNEVLGLVLAVGGDVELAELREGDVVLFSHRYGIGLEDGTYLMDEKDVLGVITEEIEEGE